MGVDRQDLVEPRAGRKRVRATLSLSAGKARPPSGASRAEAATVVAAAALALSARGIGNGQPVRWPAGTGAMLPRWAA
jgi:hypothetical protein